MIRMALDSLLQSMQVENWNTHNKHTNTGQNKRPSSAESLCLLKASLPVANFYQARGLEQRPADLFHNI